MRPGLLKDNLFNYIPIVVTGWRDGAFFLNVANHETAHLTVITIFAHGVKDNFWLSAIGVAHSLNIAAAAIHAVVVDGHGERVGVFYILTLILWSNRWCNPRPASYRNCSPGICHRSWLRVPCICAIQPR